MDNNSQDSALSSNTNTLTVTDAQPTNKIEENKPETHEKHPYSIFTNREKYCISLFIALCGIWSTLSTSIYFPALSILSEKFVVSTAVTNVSVVAYLLFQGLSPTVLSPLADAFGRRPMMVGCLLCYCAVCVGLSQTNVYWLLVVLRMLQAAAIAPIISVSSGIVGDMCPRSERGKFVGIVTGIQLVGQGFGAILGAALVDRFGWRGIFEFLAIGSGVVLIMAAILLPETNRSIVGNFSIPPKRIINDSPIVHFPFISKRLANETSTLAESNIRLSNVLSPLKIFFQVEVFFILLPSGLLFATWTMALTTFSSTLPDKYGYSIIQVGLCYLAPGFGSLTGAIASGRLLNYVYKKSKDKYDEEIKNLPKEEVKPFNIYKTRLHICLIPSLISCATYMIFGWCLEYKVNIAPALISAFTFSFCVICVMAALVTLLVDLFPNQSSAGTSCVNLMRCSLGAAGVGALQSMVDAMGEGGCYTLMAGFCLIGTVILYFIVERATKRLNNSGVEEEL
ncbi:MFS antiporter Qdrp1 [[Candida] railenensis]|uniref:MFS antiporter Qdrp1 n=1 Tax=[Candida] railenensis TaxID=45579 RepID=A0A9P0QRT5_9ASCO|nr:MFS antiporter Qdrp1 [[Candida] railenensis]